MRGISCFMGIGAYFAKKRVQKEVTIIKYRIGRLLEKAFWKTIVRAFLVLLLNIIAMSLILYKPMGDNVSLIIAGFIFWAIVVWLIIRIILFIVRNKEVIFFALRTITKDKSVISCIEKYVIKNNPKVANAFSFISKMAIFFPFMEKNPFAKRHYKRFDKLLYKKNINSYIVIWDIYFVCLFHS